MGQRWLEGSSVCTTALQELGLSNEEQPKVACGLPMVSLHKE